MDANVVYAVAKALPIKERLALCNMLQKDIQASGTPKQKKSPIPLITDEQAIEYLLKNVFNNKF